jgi:hypothetical protein
MQPLNFQETFTILLEKQLKHGTLLNLNVQQPLICKTLGRHGACALTMSVNGNTAVRLAVDMTQQELDRFGLPQTHRPIRYPQMLAANG